MYQFTIINIIIIQFTNAFHTNHYANITINENCNTGNHPSMLQFHMQCRLYACGTKREPSPHPIPLHLGEQRQSMIHPYSLGQESSLTTTIHWVRLLALQVQFHTMGMNHHQNAYACTMKACNIQSTEYDHNNIPHNANTNISHDNNSIIMDSRHNI